VGHLLKLKKAVRASPWYTQWRLSVSGTIEQCVDWGATHIIIIGILGEEGKNFATFAEWPALKRDMDEGIRLGNVKVPPTCKIEWNRIEIKYLHDEIAKVNGAVDTYLIVASAPNEAFEKVTDEVRACARA
jgi:hypothetical protein